VSAGPETPRSGAPRPGRPAWAAHLPPGLGPDDVDLLRAGTLPAAWAAHWRARPERPVVRDPAGTWLTGSALLTASAAVAGRLAAAGARRGDRVLLSGPASGDLVVAHVAALRSGLVVVPVNGAYVRRELAVIIADAEPRVALLAGASVRAWAAELDPALVVADVAGLADSPPRPGLLPPSAAAAARGLPAATAAATEATDGRADAPAALPGRGRGLPADGPVPPLDEEAVGQGDPALLPYTSGTTGTPKGALLSHGNLLASAEALRLAWRWSPDDRLVLCLPLFHMHGLGVGLHGTLLAGASAVLHERFDAEAVLAEAADPAATLLFGVPTMYARLAEAPGAGRLAGLRLCVSGSAPLGPDLHRRLGEGTGQVVLERYGMTETVMLVSNPHDGERRPGTVGLPLPGVELRLDPASGEILVRGPNVFAGYWRRPDADAEAFTPDGWFRTGDIGACDGDGYLRIVGRAKELIIAGGYNVYPREVEDVLRAHPAVADVAVVGTPTPEWGETVTAYVEPGDGFDADALAAWAADHLAPYKRPRLVYAVAALPRNALGKVVRAELSPPTAR
jgi:malonyl-CoA/methylmalonyl-CoA synthetase